ncbi:DNA-binding response regulator, partial [Pseudomonas syringae]
ARGTAEAHVEEVRRKVGAWDRTQGAVRGEALGMVGQETWDWQ